MPIQNPTSFASLLALNTESDFPLLQPGGRLTLTQTNPLGDAADSSRLFYVPSLHNFVPTWNNRTNTWNYLRIPDSGIEIGGFAFAAANFDIYAVRASLDTLGITTQGWQNDSARLRNIVQNGLQCIDLGSGVTDRYATYLGTIRTSGTNAAVRFQDSIIRRHIWNNYNRTQKPLLVVENTNQWTYSSSASRLLNNNPNNRLEMLSGLPDQPVEIMGRFASQAPSGSSAVFGMNLNGLPIPSATVVNSSTLGGENSVTSHITERSTIGLNTVQPVEAVIGGGSVTFFGFGRAGIRGFWPC